MLGKEETQFCFSLLLGVESFKIHLVFSPCQKLICTVSGLCCKHPILLSPCTYVYIAVYNSSLWSSDTRIRVAIFCTGLASVIVIKQNATTHEMTCHTIGFVSLNIVSILFISVNISSFVLLLSIQ